MHSNFKVWKNAIYTKNNYCFLIVVLTLKNELSMVIFYLETNDACFDVNPPSIIEQIEGILSSGLYNLAENRIGHKYIKNRGSMDLVDPPPF